MKHGRFLSGVVFAVLAFAATSLSPVNAQTVRSLPGSHQSHAVLAPLSIDTHTCTPLHSGSADVFCDAPTVHIACGGAIGSGNDDEGIPINWTFTNGNTSCVTVTYTFSGGTSLNCSFLFYAPVGHATGIINARLSNGAPESLNENPLNGWSSWFNATGISSLTFTDGNSQGVNQFQLGWGSLAAHSIQRTCNPNS